MIALRDYFQEKRKKQAEGKPMDGLQDGISVDEWAITYLNILRLQPITEAFDDDASGFITVSEVNTFTTSRPQGWRYISIFFALYVAQPLLVYSSGLHFGLSVMLSSP